MNNRQNYEFVVSKKFENEVNAEVLLPVFEEGRGYPLLKYDKRFDCQGLEAFMEGIGFWEKDDVVLNKLKGLFEN